MLDAERVCEEVEMGHTTETRSKDGEQLRKGFLEVCFKVMLAVSTVKNRENSCF